MEHEAISRNAKLTRGVTGGDQRGIEIGALNNPIIDPARGIVEFVDYTNTAGLKAQHAHLPDRVAGITDVHHIWTGSGSLAEVVGATDRFDFAIASHVIEHVPNTLGWFRGILEVLKPGAHFNLALPDKRYTFDLNCQVSTLGQLIEADLCNFNIPSIRQMFDHTLNIAKIEPGAIWQNPVNPATIPPYNGDFALWLAEAQAKEIMANGRYYDSHCWIYTPESFLKLLRGAALLGRFGYEIAAFDNTAPGDFEFFITLRKPEPGLDPEELKRRQVYAIDVNLGAIAEVKRKAALVAL